MKLKSIYIDTIILIKFKYFSVLKSIQIKIVLKRKKFLKIINFILKYFNKKNSSNVIFYFIKK